MSGDELQVRLEVPFLGLTKSVRISKTAEVLATTTLLAQKANLQYHSGVQYALFLVMDDDSADHATRTITTPAGWLDPLRTLASYNVKDNDVLYIKRVPVELVVTVLNGDSRSAHKAFNVDLYAHVNDIIRDICLELDLRNANEYSLESSIDVLNRDTTLYAQDIKAGSLLTLRPRKVGGTATKSMTASFAKNVGSIFGTKSDKTKSPKPSITNTDLFRRPTESRGDAASVYSVAGSVRAPSIMSMASGKSNAAGSGPGTKLANKSLLFGVPLEQAVTVGLHHYEIPLMIERMFQFLETKHVETEGIFRLSGGSNSISQLRARIDRGEDVDLSNMDEHTVTGVFKQYLRDLPNPLMTFERFEIFAGIAMPRPHEGDQRHRYYRAVIRTLPRVNYVLLKRLIGLLVKVAERKEKSKMGTVNLATVFGPTILRPKDETPEQVAMNMTIVGQVVDELITMYKKIFEHSGKEAKYTHFARTLFPFTANTPAELSFPDHTIICVTNCESNDGWWEGECQGNIGLFPENHVEVEMDIQNTEMNDDMSIVSKKLRDDLLAVNKQFKDDQTARKITEDQVIAFVARFQALEQRLAAAESNFQELTKRRVLLEEAARKSRSSQRLSTFSQSQQQMIASLDTLEEAIKAESASIPADILTSKPVVKPNMAIPPKPTTGPPGLNRAPSISATKPAFRASLYGKDFDDMFADINKALDDIS